MKYAVIIQNFVISDISKFHLTASQDQVEQFDDFYTRLRQLSEDCEIDVLRNQSEIKSLLSLDSSTRKVDVDPRSFEFIHDTPPLPRQYK